MSDVFISHVNRDEMLARDVATCLEEAGISTWFYERDSVGGLSYIEQVIEAIAASRAVILIISPDSVRSSQVDAEVIEAFEGRKPFVPLLKGVNYEEFHRLKPSWKLPLRAATALQLPDTGTRAVLGRILGGLERMGITPNRTTQPVSPATPVPPGPATGIRRTIPTALRGPLEQGVLLRLLPTEPVEAVRSLHLVARPLFRFGRARGESDFLAWFWPRNPSHDEKTARLGKVHAIAEVRHGTMVLRDGDGVRASVNGSSYDGQPLSTNTPIAVTRRGVLTLGGDFQIEILPLLEPPGEPLVIDDLPPNAPQSDDAARLRGAVRFQPLNSEPSIRDALWLFSEGTFGTGSGNAHVLTSPGLADREGCWHYHRGAFWVETITANPAIRLCETILRPGEIAPLRTGQILSLGGTPYRVEVDR